LHFLNAKPPNYTILPRGVILAYAVPRIAFGIMGTLFVVYFMKFATDVLLIAPAIIGTILAVGRLWDGITDPIIGYLSDRTRSPIGRRRLWLFCAAYRWPCRSLASGRRLNFSAASR